MLDAIFSLQTLFWLLLIPYVLCAIGLILIVLMQKGKGTGFAGAFGVGPGSEAVFGPRASQSLPVRLTYIFAGVFLVLALVLSMVQGEVARGRAPEQVAVEEELAPTGLEDVGLGSAYQDEEDENLPVAEPGEDLASDEEDVPANEPGLLDVDDVETDAGENAPAVPEVVEAEPDAPAEGEQAGGVQ
jgi:preprotein translocase subunit SecG